jgi:hypothetical protein
MSLPRLCSRLAKLEARRRPWVVADVLRRARQCAPSEVGVFLAAELTGRDQATVEAIMVQLSEAEWEALIPPEMLAFFETLTASEREALVNGGPIALQRSWRAFQRWRNRRV